MFVYFKGNIDTLLTKKRDASMFVYFKGNIDTSLLIFNFQFSIFNFNSVLQCCHQRCLYSSLEDLLANLAYA